LSWRDKVERARGFIIDMGFPDRLAAFRKERSLTQQVLADIIRVHVVQIRRYEAGKTQPTLDIIRKLAIALSVSADELIFDKDERSPDEDLRLQFEAISAFDDEDKAVARTLLESLILRHQSKRWIRHEEAG
jgi:transcriptional regulator with XRE-family HTH domain